jgi:polar amino acid transport system permease protein
MNRLKTAFAYFLALLTIALFLLFVVLRQTSAFSFDVLRPYAPLIGEGILNTILVSLIALLGSLVIGFVLYLLKISKIRYFNALVDVFTEIAYGTPLLVLIIVSAFLIGPAFGSYQRHVFGVLALVVYMAPYMKNVFQSAFSSIPKEQFLAMDLFGFTPSQRYRYLIIPQVIRILMPTLMNNFSMIIKGSALLNLLSFAELYYVINVAQSRTFAFVEGYLLMWGLYLLLTIPLSQFTKYVERKWSL